MTDAEPPADGGGGDGLVVSSTPSSVSLVRRYSVDACVALGWAEVADTVALLVSEVATNAVLHAYGPTVRVQVSVRGARLRVEVFDASPVLPVQRLAPDRAEDGRGLAIVEALAARWGMDAQPGGKSVWFEVG